MMQEYFERVDRAFGSIKVDPKWGTFTYNGIKMMGVTKFVGGFIPKFDEEKVSLAMSKGDKEQAAALVAEWHRSRDLSNALGLAAHAYLEGSMANKFVRYSDAESKELFPNEPDPVKEPYSRIVMQVDSFRDEIRGRLIPVGSEVVIGSPKYMICGIADQIFWNVKAQEFQIWDWKTNAKFRLNNDKGHFMDPISHLEDCEYHKYSMQIALYKRIFAEETGIPIGQCYLCWFSSSAPTKHMFPIRNCDAEVDIILKRRAQSMGLVDQGSVF